MWPGSGFITILLYQTGVSAASESTAILTEDSMNILTETGQEIDTEV